MADAAEKLRLSSDRGVCAAGLLLVGQPQIYWLPSDAAFLWAWGLMLVCGIGIQALGLFFRRRLLMAVGASFVCGAAIMDRDPTLFAGQILLTLGLTIMTARRKKTQSPGAARKRGRRKARA